jgi:hypothetical protein
VERADGTRIAEQNKSNLAQNPLSDRAVDFWKTLRIWTDACCSGELDPDKTIFNIYTSNPAGEEIAEAFRDTRESLGCHREGGNYPEAGSGGWRRATRRCRPRTLPEGHGGGSVRFSPDRIAVLVRVWQGQPSGRAKASGASETGGRGLLR